MGRTLVVRTASFFPPYNAENFAVHLAGTLRSGRSFRAVEDCVTSPTYVPDLVRAVLDLVINDETGLWHLASGTALSWAEFAVEIGSALHLPTHLINAQPLAAMGLAVRRPKSAAISIERGLLLPTLTSAIARFTEEMTQRNISSHPSPAPPDSAAIVGISLSQDAR